MLLDLYTMVWKEWKEMFLARGGARSGLFSLLILLALLGIFMPLQSGREWLTTPLLVLIWTWMPVFLALGMVTDAIAGERERHTLETLLASRLPDRVIVLGKIAAAVLYALGVMLSSLLLGALTVNLAFAEQGWRFYSASVFLAGLVFCLLAALLISALGVLISLTSKTARQAYQKLSAVMLLVWFVPMFSIQFLPEEIKIQLSARLATLNLSTVMALGGGLLLIADAALLAACLHRFQRQKLIGS